jgi:hypothetical protein
VGMTGIGGGTASTLILHWNGTGWRRVPSPSPGTDDYLGSVSATSARNAWAVGYTGCRSLVIRWNGTTWKQAGDLGLRGRVVNLQGVAAARGDVWAVGTSPAGGSPILHWDGVSWHQVPSPDRGTFDLQGVAITPAGNAWAVGFTKGSTLAAEKTAILYWDGASWTQQVSPNHGTGNLLLGVAIGSASRAWAVGESRHDGVRPLITRWNGSVWK